MSVFTLWSKKCGEEGEGKGRGCEEEGRRKGKGGATLRCNV